MRRPRILMPPARAFLLQWGAKGGVMDLVWIAVVIVLFALTLELIALCDPHPRGRE